MENFHATLAYHAKRQQKEGCPMVADLPPGVKGRMARTSHGHPRTSAAKKGAAIP
jgi:hypothetical protein